MTVFEAPCAPPLPGILLEEVRRHRVVFLCGPPGAGKDTLGRRIERWMEAAHPVRCRKFAGILDEMTEPLFPSRLAFQLYRETLKEAPCPYLGGHSLRVWYQRLSEQFLKPNLGKDSFGRVLLRRITLDLEQVSGVIITDSGFHAEAAPLIEWAGAENCLQVRVYREGRSFRGDTRGWWSAPGLREVHVENRPEEIDCWSVLEDGVGTKWAPNGDFARSGPDL